MPTNTREVIEQAVRQTGVVSDSLIRDNRRIIDQVAEQLDRNPDAKVKRVLRDTLEQHNLQGYDRLVDPVAQAVKQARSNRGPQDWSSSSSTQTTNVVAEMRRIVEQTGWGSRITDTDLQGIAQSRDPRQECEQLIRRLGGQPGNYRNAVDRICDIVQQSGTTPQDARTSGSSGSSGTALVTVSDYADRLRTVAAGMGLPRERVEQALEQAGMTGSAVVSPGGQDVMDAAVREIGEQVLKGLKKIIDRIEQVRDRI